MEKCNKNENEITEAWHGQRFLAQVLFFLNNYQRGKTNDEFRVKSCMMNVWVLFYSDLDWGVIVALAFY